jgi:hypothetical protein
VVSSSSNRKETIAEAGCREVGERKEGKSEIIMASSKGGEMVTGTAPDECLAECQGRGQISDMTLRYVCSMIHLTNKNAWVAMEWIHTFDYNSRVMASFQSIIIAFPCTCPAVMEIRQMR